MPLTPTFYKDQVRRFITKVNKREFEQLKQFFHPDVTFGVFIRSKGDFQDVQGVDDVLTVFQTNFGAANDILFDIKQLICEGTTVCIWGAVKGTKWLNITTSPFEIKAFTMIRFDDGKMRYFTYLPDTFASVRLTGRVSYERDDPAIIDQYLDSLVEMGLIRKREERD